VSVDAGVDVGAVVVVVVVAVGANGANGANGAVGSVLVPSPGTAEVIAVASAAATVSPSPRNELRQ
jgi:uncharacterized membrane protein YgdD (TMEM256/DUF423 family)